ncbi:RAMP superfamily CRISPR-associated protein [Vulcanisaeta moutnovskia]|uniref:RAMP superfamily CRISPR-associated protein n=1 Tax=Vulcanisaeta moutnovskia TaxID=985052 RepID=UPI001ED8D8AE|nr:RAMP superfamily CRISPR-associated protein [Vulcanisaeta moutnovskia]
MELSLTLDTPFLPGSADPNRVDPDWPLRPSEVKGIWRWWARALVAGALFERGLLHGEPTSSIVKVPTSEEASCISRIVGLNLELGYAGKRDSRASCIRIIINPDDQQLLPSQLITDELINIFQRIKLLTLRKSKKVKVKYRSDIDRGKVKVNPEVMKELDIEDKIEIIIKSKFKRKSRKNIFIAIPSDDVPKGEIWCNENDAKKLGINNNTVIIRAPISLEYIAVNRTIKLIIDKNPFCKLNGAAVEASLSALALALKYSCFGKGGRRGLGCFSINASGPYSKLFMMDAKELINYAVERVSKVVDSAIKDCRLKESKLDKCELPPMPVISKGINYIDCVENSEVRNSISKALNNALHPYMLIKVTGPNVLDTLHNFFLRPRRTIALLGSHHRNDDLRATYNAWVLGLPREQKNTGYMIKSSDVSRRASPFIVSVHGDRAYVSVFTSADWPTQLEWRGAGSQSISVNQGRVINAIAIALKELIDYSSKSGLQVVRVWP